MTPHLYVGFARRDISPPPGIDLSGFGFRFGASLGTLEPLELSALAVTDGNQTALLFSLDLVGLTLEHLADLRARMAEISGVPAANQMWTCTHTHGAPETGVLPGMGGVDDDYLASVGGEALTAARVALVGMSPVELWLGCGRSFMGANRRSAAFNPRGPHDGEIDDIDPTVVVAEFRDPNQKPRALLVNYGCHPTGSRECVSTSDYPGHCRRVVSAAADAPCMFVNGAGGDVNQRFDPSGRRSAANARRRGEELADVTLAVRPHLRRSQTRTVAAASRPAGLHYAAPIDAAAAQRILEDGRQRLAAADGTAQRRRIAWHQVAFAERVLRYTPGTAPDLTVQVQALRIGDLAVAALPSEFFAADGTELRRTACSPSLMLAGWSNGLVGYTPTRRAMQSGGYEVDDAHRWYGHPAAWDPVSGDNLRAAACAAVARTFRA